MDTHEQRMKLIKSTSGMGVDPTHSDQEIAARIKLILDLYLAGYELHHQFRYDPNWIKTQQIPRNFACLYRVIE